MRPGSRNRLRWGAAVAVLLMTAAADARAQTVSQAVATFDVVAQARLSVTPATLAFPDADPTTAPTIAASSGPVTVAARVRFAPGQAVLTVVAANDLQSGMTTIPVSAIRWAASGSGFASGTMSKSTAQLVAAWTTSGNYTGTLAFTLSNSWTYATGSYSTTFIYTLSTP